MSTIPLAPFRTGPVGRSLLALARRRPRLVMLAALYLLPVLTVRDPLTLLAALAVLTGFGIQLACLVRFHSIGQTDSVSHTDPSPDTARPARR